MDVIHNESLLTEVTPAPERKKRPPVITWGGFIVALFLLLNPMPMILDLLPDAIAYLLILFALRRAVGEIDVFNDFKKTTSKLLLVSAVKIPAFFLMLNVWGGDTRQRSIVAVFALAFSIVEFLFLRSWIRDLFDATARYGQKYDCHAALAECGDSYRLSPEKLERLTFIFFIVRAILSCLPEMTLVPLPADTATADYVFNWNAMYPVCALVAAIAVMIFGVIWFCYISAYFKRIARDKEAAARMQADITRGSRAERENDFRLIRLATYFLLAGVILQIDLLFDNVNYLPDVLSALLFFAAGYSLYHLLGRHRIAYILPLIYAGTSLIYTIFYNRFYHLYGDAALAYRDDGALMAYVPVAVTGVLCGILLILSVLYLLFALRGTVKHYTGITQNGLTARHLDEKLRHTTPAEEEIIRGTYGVIAAKTRRELRIKTTIYAIIGCVVAAITMAKDLLMFIAPPPMSGKGQDPDFLTLFVYGGVDTAIWISVIIWTVFTAHLCTRIRKEAELNLIEE